MHRNSLVTVKGEPDVEDKETRDPATNVMSLDFSIFRDEVIATGEIPRACYRKPFGPKSSKKETVVWGHSPGS